MLRIVNSYLRIRIRSFGVAADSHSHRASARLSFTPGFSPVNRVKKNTGNRFNGFHRRLFGNAVNRLKRFPPIRARTGLKPGVNESYRTELALAFGCAA